jgi:hypothetical protein
MQQMSAGAFKDRAIEGAAKAMAVARARERARGERAELLEKLAQRMWVEFGIPRQRVQQFSITARHRPENGRELLTCRYG